MVLVTRQAPDFTSSAVLGNGEIVNNFNFKKHVNGKAAVLFFYPLDFTFVCPSELIAFDHRYEEFKKRGVEVVGVSIDSEFTHNAWRNTPTENGGIGAVKYALAADVKLAASSGTTRPVCLINFSAMVCSLFNVANGSSSVNSFSSSTTLPTIGNNAIEGYLESLHLLFFCSVC